MIFFSLSFLVSFDKWPFAEGTLQKLIKVVSARENIEMSIMWTIPYKKDQENKKSREYLWYLVFSFHFFLIFSILPSILLLFSYFNKILGIFLILAVKNPYFPFCNPPLLFPPSPFHIRLTPPFSLFVPSVLFFLPHPLFLLLLHPSLTLPPIYPKYWV